MDMMQTKNQENRRVAVVTGASGGIGRAIARKLAGDGCFVVVNYCGSGERAEAVVKEIQSAGGEACAMQCDVSRFSEAEKFFKEVLALKGRIDILVNNAGITRDGLLMKMSEEDFDRVLEVNLKGAFNGLRQVSRQMVKQRSGRIISISSVSGVLGNAGQAIMRHQRPGSSPDQVGGKGAGLQRNYGECRGPRLCGYGNDQSAV